MPQQKKQTLESQDSKRASRLRDNKRRHRARKKEYVQDLERRLAESRENGVQATKEVQLAAQKVLQDNVRLRELLRRTGYSDEAIDAWLKLDGSEQRVLPTLGPKQDVTSSLDKEHCATKGSCPPLTEQGIIGDSLALSTTVCKSRCYSTETSTCASATLDLSPLPNKPEISSTPCARGCSSSPSQNQQKEPTRPPCKLLTILSENPSADITQVPLPPISSQGKYEDKEGGVECSKAYSMLMHYATSEEKLDNIAKALEEGCTPSKGGGCKVGTNAILIALDKVTN